MKSRDLTPPRPGTIRPGGRTERTRLAIAQAVLDLFAEGRINFTVTEVAERAGVHRSTMHRRWRTRAEVIAEALSLQSSRVEIPDTGNFADDMRALAAALVEHFCDPAEISMNVALASTGDPELLEASERQWGQLALDLGVPIERAIERGEISPDANPVALLQLLIGALLMHIVIMRSIPEPPLVDQLVEAVIRAAGPAPQ